MHSRYVLRGVPFVFSHIVRVSIISHTTVSKQLASPPQSLRFVLLLHTFVFLWCVTPQKQIQVHIHTLTPHDTKVSIRTL